MIASAVTTTFSVIERDPDKFNVIIDGDDYQRHAKNIYRYYREDGLGLKEAHDMAKMKTHSFHTWSRFKQFIDVLISFNIEFTIDMKAKFGGYTQGVGAIAVVLHEEDDIDREFEKLSENG